MNQQQSNTNEMGAGSACLWVYWILTNGCISDIIIFAVHNTSKEGRYMELEETKELMLDFNKIDSITDSGAIPVVVQDIDTKEVLLLAYVNKTALEESIKQRKVILWSTSRKKLWFKGAESGNTFTLHRIFVNCEQNSLLFMASPDKGGMCHTKRDGEYRRGCYYRELDMETMGLSEPCERI